MLPTPKISQILKSSKIQGIQYQSISKLLSQATIGGLASRAAPVAPLGWWPPHVSRQGPAVHPVTARPGSDSEWSGPGKWWCWSYWVYDMVIYGVFVCICVYVLWCFWMFFFPPARCWSLDLYQNISDTPHTYTRPLSQAGQLSGARWCLPDSKTNYAR